MWRGTPWLSHRVRVVEDSAELLAVHTPEGARFESPPGSWPWDGGHPWLRGSGRWDGHGPLVLHRPGDDFTVWAMWHGPERTFSGWYVNFQEAPRRTAEGFDTYDQELDIVVEVDGTWRLKDDELMDGWIERGRFTPDEVARIRAEAARVGALLDRREWWWDEAWAGWRPDPAWRVL